jgi:hypothetical protein
MGSKDQLAIQTAGRENMGPQACRLVPEGIERWI